jgi:hypothetical protein
MHNYEAPGHLENKIFMVPPDVCRSSVLNLLNETILVRRVFDGAQIFGKFVDPWVSFLVKFKIDLDVTYIIDNKDLISQA